MRRIVVGFDGSEPARRALLRAADLADAFDAKLVVTSVGPPDEALLLEPGASALEPGLSPIAPAPVPGPPIEPVEALALPNPAEGYLEDARTALAGRRLEADFVAKAGRPAEMILEVAEERDADLVVVGNHEHTLLERLLGHRVSEVVSRHAHRDVLLVH